MTAMQERPGDETEALQKAGQPVNDITPQGYATESADAEKLTFPQLLEALGHGDARDLHRDQVAICWKRPEGVFTSELQDPEDAQRCVEMFTASVPGGVVNMWFGVNPVSRDVVTGRGKLKDVTRLAALYADLDVKVGGCPDLDAARLIIDDVSEVLGARPFAVIYSGHGLQPIWPVERASAEAMAYPHDAAKLLQRFRHVVETVAARHGCKVDPVFDLPRILRVPGTVNWKDVEQPAPTWCEADTGKPVTVEQIRQALDDFGAPEDRPRFGSGGQGPQVFSRRALVARVAKAPEGRRNNTLFGAAKDAARQGDLDADLADKLADAASAAGLDSGEINSTIYSAALSEDVDIIEAPARPASYQECSDGDDEQDDAQFWAQREILSHIRQFSRSRLAAPHAVLGAVLRRAITLVEPTVQLPPIVGTSVSLNLFTVAVGRSGQGKDAANGVGRDAVQFVTPDGEPYDDPASGVGIGSGEGLARIFKGFGNEDSPPPHVNLEVNEIGTLGALAARKGSTLIGELLKAYMGQALGFTNAQKATTTFVPPHGYRLCLGIGAQPENGGLLLDLEKDGFPQRFLWVPTVDPFGPRTADDEPEEPPAARVAVPTFPTVITGAPHLVRIPSSVREEVRSARRSTNWGSTDVDPLDGHLNLTRLKVSFGLALLEGRPDVTEDDWRIAGQLIEMSNRTRAGMRATLAANRKRASTARAHDEADRKIITDERMADDRHRRVWGTIVRKLSKVSTATRRDLQRACDSSISRDFPSVFDWALDQEKLVIAGGDGNATLYRLGAD